MSVDKFKFVSPGIFIDEIDESALPNLPERMGPLVIGRFQKGPAHLPVKVNSFSEFVSIFGPPSAGNASGDIWRTGELTAPTYAAYAVQAWLRNNSPCTVYRVLGQNPSDANAAAADATTPRAGWQTDKTPSTAQATAGGAYGLFIIPSASVASPVTGTLAAIWYLQEGYVALTGTVRGGNQTLQGAGLLIANGAGGATEFTAKILDEAGAEVKQAKFNFDRDSKSFIRRAFNTNPTKTNGALNATADTLTYWLGETFESNLFSAENGKLAISGAVPDHSNTFGFILQLKAPGTQDALSTGYGHGAGTDNSDSDIDWHDRLMVARAAKTGWFISQDNRGDVTASFDPTSHTDELFRFVALGGSGATEDPGCGEASNRDVKISITDIKAPTDGFNKYGTFSVLVREAGDTDTRPIVLERYSSLNLNPTSANFIKRVIGDRHYTYQKTNKTVREHGSYPNRSKYVRVDVSDVVDMGQAAGLHPFGVYGPAVPKTFTLLSGSTGASSYAVGSGSLPSESMPAAHLDTEFAANHMVYPGGEGNTLTASIVFPTVRTRISSSDGGLILGSKAFFGYQSNIKGKRRLDQTSLDLLRAGPAGLDPWAASSPETEYSWVFTLDDLTVSPDDADHAVHISGSRATSATALGISYTAQTGSVQGVLGAGYNKFTSPMFGGFDGFDVTEKDPLRNTFTDGGKEKTNYAYYSLKKAIDMTSDDEYVEFDVATMPGITNSTLNSALVDACENRADSLAIIDLEGNFQPPHEHEKAASSSDKAGSVSDVITELNGLSINSSYGCTFYPFVRIRDTINDAVLYVPPSVVALGTFSSSQRKSAVWFAPAGFTRGGLSEGSAGLPVIGVKERVVAADRDKLYDANINPIATFPAEGIVIFGQKTLQVTQSALDRINVRRLLIYLKKEVSRIASRVLFDQNVQQTWDRFTGQVIPFLEGVKAGLGLTDFKVVLDETTTTPDLIDRNILYAKIFLKPARAIEFIALDFIITRSGASFDD